MHWPLFNFVRLRTQRLQQRPVALQRATHLPGGPRPPICSFVKLMGQEVQRHATTTASICKCPLAVHHRLSLLPSFMKRWNHIGVVGAGTMGSGLPKSRLSAGCSVVCRCRSGGVDSWQSNFQRCFEGWWRKTLTESGSRNRSTDHRTTDLQALAQCDAVVEAIVEDLTAKTSLFRTLETIVPSCSSCCQHLLAFRHGPGQWLLASERVIGLHFFNPAPLMTLVEVVPALQSRPELTEEAMENGCVGKSPPKPETHPGSSSTVWRLLQRSPRILEEGIATVANIDASMRAQGFRMGPFELMDLIGHDVNFAVTSSVLAALWRQQVPNRPHPKTTCGRPMAWQKSGRGFCLFKWPKSGA